MKELEYLSCLTNRRLSQQQFLYELCGNSLCRLIRLEAQIKSNHISYCPSTKQEVDNILSLTPQTDKG